MGTKGREVVVISAKQHAKGKAFFDAAADRVEWVVSEADEPSLIAALSASKARVLLLGAEKYGNPALYRTLKDNCGAASPLILRYGVGYDGVDLAQCKELGILVANTPGTLDRSVAEHAMALMLACAKNVAFLDSSMRSGAFPAPPGIELAGKTLGLVGFGPIARETARMAAYGFSMRVRVYDHNPLEELARRESTDAAAFAERYRIDAYHGSFEACAAEADVLSLHIPVRPETVKYMDARRLAAMKRGAILINTGRGRLVDEVALYDALASGALRSAGLDVFDQEPYVPARPDKDLRALANTVLTSHTASNTDQSNLAIQKKALANIQAYAEGRFGDITLVPQR